MQRHHRGDGTGTHDQATWAWVRSRLVLLLAVSFLGSAGASGQLVPSSEPPATTPSGPPRIAVSSSAQRLWIARLYADHVRLNRRTAAGEFEPARRIAGAVGSIAAGPRDLLLFMRNGAVWRVTEDGLHPSLDLPGEGTEPVDALWNTAIYALVPAASAAGLPLQRVDDGAEGAQPELFEPIDREALCVITLSGSNRHRTWTVIAPAPDVVRTNEEGKEDRDGALLQPKLGLIRGGLYLFHVAAVDRLRVLRWDFESGSWDETHTLNIPRLRDFWFATVNEVPTLVAAVERDARPELTAYRLLGHGAESAGTWRQWEIPVSPTPKTYLSAFGFNQHLGVLVEESGGGWRIVFARPDGSAVEQAIDLQTLFEDKPATPPAGSLFQMATLFVLMAVIASLFVFRRGSMTTPAELPAPYFVAFTLQRLVGFAIDLFPITFVLSLILDVRWSYAFGELFGWAAGSDVSSAQLPEVKTLSWWLGSVAIYTTYAFVMELFSRRTIGKVVMRTAVFTEKGEGPRFWQLLVRNVFRFLELLPPFWVMGFLVVLSRNRQRLGDIFGRTVVARAARRGPTTLVREIRPVETKEPTHATAEEGEGESETDVVDDSGESEAEKQEPPAADGDKSSDR